MAVAGCGDSGSAATPAPASATAATARATAGRGSAGAVRVTLGAPTEFAMRLSRARVRAGMVRFAVANRGRATHEFVVLRTSRRAAALPVSGGRASEAGHVGEIGDLAPGASKRLSLRLRAGHYTLLCNLPGHYSRGMRADFTVL